MTRDNKVNSMNKKVLMLIPTLYLIRGAQDQLKLVSKYLISMSVPLDIKSIFENQNSTKSKSNIPSFGYLYKTHFCL